MTSIPDLNWTIDLQPSRGAGTGLTVKAVAGFPRPAVEFRFDGAGTGARGTIELEQHRLRDLSEAVGKGQIIRGEERMLGWDPQTLTLTRHSHTGRVVSAAKLTGYGRAALVSLPDELRFAAQQARTLSQ